MSKAYPTSTGTGNSGSHPMGSVGGGKPSPSEANGPPQPHDIPGTMGGVHSITGPRLTSGNVGPLNAPIYEETVEDNSGSL